MSLAVYHKDAFCSIESIFEMASINRLAFILGICLFDFFEIFKDREPFLEANVKYR